MPSDGKFFAVGNQCNHVGYAIVFAYSSTTNTWNPLGDDIVGSALKDHFGCSVSMFSDDVTMDIDAPYNDDSNGHNSGNARVLTYDSITNTWNILGNTIVGAQSFNNFGY